MRTAALALLLALLPACATGPAAPAPGTPLFDGKPLSHWLGEMGDLEPERRRAACGAVRAFGRAGIPGIIELCSSEYPVVREDALETLGYLSFDRPPDPEIMAVLLAATKDPVEEVRDKAASMLHYQKPLPAEARAALEGMRDGDPAPWVRKQAGKYLEDLGKWERGEE